MSGLAKCGRCKEPAPFGFGPPHGHENRGTMHACFAHRDAADAAWRRRYPESELHEATASPPTRDRD